MSTFQKLLHRFLGQIEGSYNPNGEPLDSPSALEKIGPSRRQRSLEALKSASCLSCGISKDDCQPSIVAEEESPLAVQRQQIVKEKRRAKTKLVIIRHGERVDALFGDSWFEQAFDAGGTYRRFHTNLPVSLPYRQHFRDYQHDPPLTELGLIRSYRTGEALFRTGLRIDHCYSSPSLRCIQTADAMLDGMKLRTLVPIRIELGLFECGSWHKGVIPHFMSINELVLNRFHVETSYNSVQKCLSTEENEGDYYERSHEVMREILAKHELNDETILFIGHAPSLETLTRQLIGAPPRPHELAQIAQKINYLSLTILEGHSHSWTFVDAILAKQTS